MHLFMLIIYYLHIIFLLQAEDSSSKAFLSVLCNLLLIVYLRLNINIRLTSFKYFIAQLIRGLYLIIIQ